MAGPSHTISTGGLGIVDVPSPANQDPDIPKISQFGVNGVIWSADHESAPKYCMTYDTVEEIILDNTMFSFEHPRMIKIKNVTITHPFHIHVNHFQVMGIEHRTDVKKEIDEAQYAALQVRRGSKRRLMNSAARKITSGRSDS